jgi:3-dehydroquinate dehydratase-2
MNLDALENQLSALAESLSVKVSFFQSDSESELMSQIHKATDSGQDVILNPAAFTHYSYALSDACKAHTSSGAKLIEVHISNPHARELFRHKSVISATATGVIAGFGFDSYKLALRQLAG